ncbi:MAG: Na+/H+ antiporter subunit E [Desulfohalobiaceae bacterium]|nr:Na+/H+ antiporter subunit E [Desulfohalobiaceae bacterium]
MNGSDNELRRKSSGLTLKKRIALKWLNSVASFGITFVLMFGLWLVLSGNFEPLLIVLGLFSSLVVSFFFYDLLFPGLQAGYLLVGIRFSRYIPWLLVQIIKANLHLLYLVFHPRMHAMIDPHIVSFRSGLQKDMSIVTLANSITLTPGTITVNADREGSFRVHAIDRDSSRALPGEMLKKVARIFGEAG